ncbi:cobalamin-dependent protein [Paenibacillus sp. Marseille-Q4541]|uniref:cobalamin B12-binding domain-containing protein n=1 Tax=Paenibacillus sp. Marseille-Q4541 TaxID=2831522 RepID=UPI001BABEAF3|nr:cobalamin-dependent protein [Paenibacillus sp. Marseille-Q4541]
MNATNNAAGEAFLREVDHLAEQITDRQYEIQPELELKFGESGRIRTKQDTVYSLRFLAESVMMKSPSLFTQYVSWLKILLAGYRVTEEDLRINLSLIKEFIEQTYNETDKELVLEYLQRGMQEIAYAEPIPTYVAENQPYHHYTAMYLESLLSADREAAWSVVVELLEAGTSVKDIYIFIFQRSQLEIGRLWQMGNITVAQEHLCTAATQANISKLYPYWLTNGNNGYKMLAACVGSELHEIGLRMLTDHFEMEGWDTYYLGANVPHEGIIDSIQKYNVDVLALSVTMTFHVHLAKRLIDEVRSNPATKDVSIIVGGLPFNIDQELWKEIGADGYAPDEVHAIELAYSLQSPKAE